MRIQDANVAVIEDNANNLRLLQTVLIEHIAVKSYFAQASGAMFFRWLDSGGAQIPDLILLDIQLPREDGFTVIQHIRQRAELNATKVVAVTANVLGDDQERLRAAGFNGLLGKPIRVGTLETQLTGILNGETIWDVR